MKKKLYKFLIISFVFFGAIDILFFIDVILIVSGPMVCESFHGFFLNGAKE